MKQRTRVLVAAVLVLLVALGAGVAAWRYAHRAPPVPAKPEASDEVVVDFAMAQLNKVAEDVVRQCGTGLAHQQLDAKVRVATVLEGVEVRGFELERSQLSPEQGACVTKVFVTGRGHRTGRYSDAIPAGREYELEAHLELPLPTTDYNR
jgi:hypothetical protein